MRVKARKSPERKAKKIKVHNGRGADLLNLLILHKEDFYKFNEVVAEEFNTGYICFYDRFSSTDQELIRVYEFLSNNASNNTGVVVSYTNGRYRHYFGIRVHEEFYMFYIPSITSPKNFYKLLDEPKINTYSPDYLMQHVEQSLLHLDKHKLFSEDIKIKLSITKTLRKLRSCIARGKNNLSRKVKYI